MQVSNILCLKDNTSVPYHHHKLGDTEVETITIATRIRSSKITNSASTQVNNEKVVSLNSMSEINCVRRDCKGNPIQKTNKKKYHICFKDQLKNGSLVEFVDIPPKNYDESLKSVPIFAKDEKASEHTSCACLVF